MMIYGNARHVFKKIHEQPADTSGYQRIPADTSRYQRIPADTSGFGVNGRVTAFFLMPAIETVVSTPCRTGPSKLGNITHHSRHSQESAAWLNRKLRPQSHKVNLRGVTVPPDLRTQVVVGCLPSSREMCEAAKAEDTLLAVELSALTAQAHIKAENFAASWQIGRNDQVWLHCWSLRLGPQQKLLICGGWMRALILPGWLGRLLTSKHHLGLWMGWNLEAAKTSPTTIRDRSYWDCQRWWGCQYHSLCMVLGFFQRSGSEVNAT